VGHGANASEELILKLSEGQLTHPHNDWLRFLYDYGIVGAALFLLTVINQVRHLLKKAWNTEGELRTFFFAAASSFLPFVLMMFTDNIVLYAAFYGNLQFTIIGLAYAAEKRARLEKVLYEEDEFYETNILNHRGLCITVKMKMVWRTRQRPRLLNSAATKIPALDQGYDIPETHRCYVDEILAVPSCKNSSSAKEASRN